MSQVYRVLQIILEYKVERLFLNGEILIGESQGSYGFLAIYLSNHLHLFTLMTSDEKVLDFSSN